MADTGEDYGDEEEEAGEKAGPPPKADYHALAAWAQTRLGVKLKEPDLRKLGHDEIQETLVRAARERLESIDFSATSAFLQPDYRLAALADWADKKFDFGLRAADFQDLDRDAAARLLQGRLQTLYEQKEQSYPVESAIEEHLVAQAGSGQQDFDGLAAWASRHYLAPVRPEDIRHRDPREVRRRLLEVSREFHESDRLNRTVDEGLRRYAPHAGQETPERWQPLAQWAKECLGLEITPEQFIAAAAQADGEKGADPLGHQGSVPSLPSEGEEAAEAPAPLTPQAAVTAMLKARAQADRRARMTELERYLLLQVHDTSWKDHLLVMDHLKSGVGLRGYAQLNPLIEFKKEGLESFERMLDSSREKFTDLFFKARWVRQEALARIWAGQSTEHAVAASAYDAQRQAALDMTRKAQMADEGEEVVKTIVRAGPKVGRNDPCPCGSGKKYKKCCGART
ncbi:MAG: SEC-C metal-binding domain-containing protein [Planctomycetota bacterium]|nr:SEC-C metal-binding domain-containing protein [Planctomycetota bacterium]